ncbi:hypothetical protein [Lacicoccus qingdaonensis]|nr:hypothetical protein [Salinicoccus qingdaonensis]
MTKFEFHPEFEFLSGQKQLIHGFHPDAEYKLKTTLKESPEFIFW